MSSNKRIGAADADALISSIATAPNAGIGDAFSIERAAGRVINQMRHACRGCATSPAQTAVTTYIFCDDLEDIASHGLCSDIHYVWTSDLTIQFSDLQDRVVFVSRNGNAGCTSKQIFGSFREQAKFVFDSGLRDSTTVVFYPGQSKYTIFPQGLASESCEHRTFGTISSLLVGDELSQVLQHFETKWVNAPAGNKKLWAKFKGHTHVPCANTEKVVQEHLQLHLIAADRSATVVDEIWNSDGRADLFIYSAPQVTDGAIVLELKVLRTHSYPEKQIEKNGKVVVSSVASAINVASAQEVVKQAASYKHELSASRAFARVYDMRKQPAESTPVDEAKKLAGALDVNFEACPVHYSVQDSRNEKIQQMLTKVSSTSGK